eukprot:GILK01012687.1.p1 GENE.GILK01012687.1~~GILK01012687.1.p1  ORF type:complete len:378 (-),score=38.54 GILK01012687.1:60-1193(-)
MDESPQIKMKEGEKSSLLDSNDTKSYELSSSAVDLLPLNSVQEKKVPWWAWMGLALSLVAVSSAATVFRVIDDVPPLMRSTWRLELTAVFQFPCFLYQLHHADTQTRNVFKQSLLIELFSACMLGLHFGAWVWSIDHTSLVHSLLWVSASPIVIIVGLFLLCKRVSTMEVVGTLMGFGGGALMCIDLTNVSSTVTFAGDAVAFVGAIAMVGYLYSGRLLREDRRMPLFLYAFPVTFLSAVFSAVLAVWLEDGNFGGTGVRSVFGWHASQYFVWVLYLAAVPGMLGHTVINFIIRYISPLVVTVTLVMEPLVGSFLAWLVGVDGIPHMWTWIGAPIMFVGTLLTTIASDKNKPDAKAGSELSSLTSDSVAVTDQESGL